MTLACMDLPLLFKNNMNFLQLGGGIKDMDSPQTHAFKILNEEVKREKKTKPKNKQDLPSLLK